MKNIVNIINFIRTHDPRDPQRDLVKPVEMQLKLLKEYGFKGTFLLQYDALISPIYQSLLKGCEHEIGAWFEIVQPLVEKVGLPWRGREGYSWDWFAHVGMLIGYMPKERELLIDGYMSEFKNVFGYYPASVGCWVWDAHSLKYLQEKYGVKAACICKEQYGTDGYTLWGGYYNGGYYPSENNALAPARNGEKQISLPVFRMLGIDPVYQYDYGMDILNGSTTWQGVITLEPACRPARGGANPAWVDWYLKENFNGKQLAYAYTQIGQENSMGWGLMEKGLLYQFSRLAQVQKEYRLEILTLQETGEWFLGEFSNTPSTSFFCDNDYLEKEKRSCWYNSSYYRTNIFFENEEFWIRDLYVFLPENTEKYLKDRCEVKDCFYYTLPLVDGNRWTGRNIRAGLYFIDKTKGEKVKYTNVQYMENANEVILSVTTETFRGIKITCGESFINIAVEKNYEQLLLQLYYDDKKIDVEKTEIAGNYVKYCYNQVEYAVQLQGGCFENNGDCIIFKNKEINVAFL